MTRSTLRLAVRSTGRAWRLEKGSDDLMDGRKAGTGRGRATKPPRRRLKAVRRAANARARTARRRNRR